MEPPSLGALASSPRLLPGDKGRTMCQRSHSSFELVTSPPLYPFSSLTGLPGLLKSPWVSYGTRLKSHLLTLTGTGHFPEMQEGDHCISFGLCYPSLSAPWEVLPFQSPGRISDDDLDAIY